MEKRTISSINYRVLIYLIIKPNENMKKEEIPRFFAHCHEN